MLFFHACLNADVLFGGSASITVGVLKVTECPEELPWFCYLIKHFSWSSKIWRRNWWPKALMPKSCVCAIISVTKAAMLLFFILSSLIYYCLHQHLLTVKSNSSWTAIQFTQTEQLNTLQFYRALYICLIHMRLQIYEIQFPPHKKSQNYKTKSLIYNIVIIMT